MPKVVVSEKKETKKMGFCYTEWCCEQKKEL